MDRARRNRLPEGRESSGSTIDRGDVAAAGIGSREREPPVYFSFERPMRSIDELDGLRALAVLLVLARHAVRPLQSASDSSEAAWSPYVPLLNGWVGVDLFFVLSGFLIGGHLLRQQSRTADIHFGRYIGGRVLRIVPAYFFVLFVVAAGVVPDYPVDTTHLGFRLLYHVLFLQDYLPANIVVSFWSLGVEEKFYLLAPFVVAIAWTRSSRQARYGLLVLLMLVPTLFRALAVSAHPDVSGYETFFPVFRSPFHMSFDGMIAGLVIAFLHHERQTGELTVDPLLARRIYAIGIVLLGAHLLAGSMLAEVTVYDKSVQGLAIALAFAAILFGVLFGEMRHVLLRSSAGLFLARISYPLYLVHLPLVEPLHGRLGAWSRGEPFAECLYLLAFLLLSVFIATVVHFGVEKPFLRLKARLQW